MSADPFNFLEKGERMFINLRFSSFVLFASLCASQFTIRQYYSTYLQQPEETAESKRSAVQDVPPLKWTNPEVRPALGSDQSYYANAHPYIDEAIAQLIERIPELRTLRRPASDQQELAVILQKMGRRVDAFFQDIGDLIAHEDVIQERLNAKGKTKGRERFQDSYLILHHGDGWGARAEYRMDEKGNRLGGIGLEKGYLVTSGFALSCIGFSTAGQSQSKWRYLGEQSLDSREVYVLGFAQQPGKATFTEVWAGSGATPVEMLIQGILWVDKNSFQIIQMRSDLLAPRIEMRLMEATTKVTFGETRLPDVPNSLWLPQRVDVYLEIGGRGYHNVHHYTDYRRYRVSAKILVP